MLCAEKKRLGIVPSSKHDNKEVQKMETAFADDIYCSQVQLKVKGKCKKQRIVMQKCVKLLEVKHKSKRSWFMVRNRKPTRQ